MFVPATIDIQQDREKFQTPVMKVWVREPNKMPYFEVFDNFREAYKFIKESVYADKHPLICYDGYEINIFDYKLSDDYDFLLKEAVGTYIRQVFYGGIARESDNEEINRMFAGVLAFIHTNMIEKSYMPVDSISYVVEEQPRSLWQKLFGGK